jgi:cobyrinic acid a,c-diamide synthase
MKKEDAQALVQNFHDNKAKDELEAAITSIGQKAQAGFTELTFIFDYAKNAEILKSRGFDVVFRSKNNNDKDQNVYLISWREDV